MKGDTGNEPIEISEFVTNWPIPAVSIGRDTYDELAVHTTELLNELVIGCEKIVLEHERPSIDLRAVRHYADLLKLDRMLAFPLELPASLRTTTTFIPADYELLHSTLTGPSRSRYAPLPPSFWSAVWDRTMSLKGPTRIEAPAAQQLSAIANRGLLELFAAAYVSTWLELSKSLRTLAEVGLTISVRPAHIVVEGRQVSTNCKELPFPLNFLK